ncbi:protein ACTIVITY OF BC1 COMPLEX KINASE 7, chloroplastic-like isoform X2 [Zingiber officinale]|uniref:protein ACTIVITY OF BC1 COMPLEX KINASE 7, chloroplastic-like isoform X2 n=1 Tax=Zingiber officinale TaxID=94328 RepID=UPI001C4C9183|nr:protein ACTIVITY OF BC1 COMPLEX KINASE 7, chloroplastic-like isoform X2 [Zingiber officinale]
MNLLAFSSCYHQFLLPLDKRQAIEDLTFSKRISRSKFLTFGMVINGTRGLPQIFAKAAQTESHKYATNGSIIKMVPTKDLVKRKNPSPKKTLPVKGSEVVFNSSIVRTEKKKAPREIPFTDEVKVLPLDEGFSWANENYNYLQRNVEIWNFVFSLQFRVHLINAKWSYIDGFTEEKQKIRRRKTASWLREQILQLGPTFIKLGQQFSTRSDFLPQEFVEELAKLQDRVPAFSPEKAKAFIKHELDAPVEVLFKKFQDHPIAAASLGQVHRAILHSGEQVVVKIQRPGLKKLFDIDFRNLKLIVEHFQRTETFGIPAEDWLDIYNECSKTLYQEIDYINEGKNADRFRRDFRNIKWVHVPLIYWDYTSTKVLTLEYAPGIKINNVEQIDARGYSRSLIASRAVESYLIQILKNGFFHADPHPGNISVAANGTLVYYDFGMMGEIKSFTRERLLQLFYAIYEKDVNKVTASLIELETLRPTGDLSAVRKSIKFFLDFISSQTPEQQQSVAVIGEDLFTIAADQPFRFPATFTFVLRAFATLEGIGNLLDPNFSFAKVAEPYIQELLDVRKRQSGGTEIVEEIRKQANDARDYTMSMPYRIHKIEEFVKQLESGEVKLRVKVLESERAARRASVLQMATMYTAFSGTLLNVGVTLASQGQLSIANVSFIGACVFWALAIRSMQRVKRLDKFEKML